MGAFSCIKACICGFSMSNTGTDCTPLMKVAKRLILQSIFDNTGTRNYIDLTDTLDETYFSDLINEADASKRLFPLPEVKDVKDTRSAPVVQKFADDSTIFIRDGIRTFDGMIVGKAGSTILKGKIEAARCNEMGVYIVDKNGDLIGTISDDGTKLYPIRIDSESLSAMFVKETDTTAQALQIQFNFHPDESDACLRMVQNSELTDVDLLTLKGLIDAYAKFTNPTTTGVTMKVYTSFGTPKNPTVVKGLTAPEFISHDGGATSKVYNKTDDADVAVTVTETAIEGTYTLAWAAQGSGEKIIVNIKGDGYDFTSFENDEVTIP